MALSAACCLLSGLLCCPVVCAAVISECAAGGQVLLDAATFQTVRPQLHLLGAVTAAGLDYRSLDAAPQDALRADCWQACR
jgi:hypothetical protein